jgi:hypothetical protein
MAKHWDSTAIDFLLDQITSYKKRMADEKQASIDALELNRQRQLNLERAYLTRIVENRLADPKEYVDAQHIGEDGEWHPAAVIDCNSLDYHEGFLSRDNEYERDMLKSLERARTNAIVETSDLRSIVPSCEFVREIAEQRGFQTSHKFRKGDYGDEEPEFEVVWFED